MGEIKTLQEEINEKRDILKSLDKTNRVDLEDEIKTQFISNLDFQNTLDPLLLGKYFFC